MHNLKIIPGQALKDGALEILYEKMVEDHTSETVFMDGSISNAQEFVKAMKGVQFFCVVDNEKPAMMFWLNNFTSRAAQAHFCVFKEFWGKRGIELGKHCLQEFLHKQDDKGYILDVITGQIPTRNKRAVQYVKKVGMKKVGVLPKSIWNKTTQKSEDTLIVYIERKE